MDQIISPYIPKQIIYMDMASEEHKLYIDKEAFAH